MTMFRALLAAIAVVISLPAAAQVKPDAMPAAQPAALQSNRPVLRPGMKLFAQQWCSGWNSGLGVKIEVDSVSADGTRGNVLVLTDCWNHTHMIEPRHRGSIAIVGNEVTLKFWRSSPVEDFSKGGDLVGAWNTAAGLHFGPSILRGYDGNRETPELNFR